MNGLGWIAGHVRRFADGPSLRVPHMGWNDVEPAEASGCSGRPAPGVLLRAQLFPAGRRAARRSRDAATTASHSRRRRCTATSGRRSSIPRRASRTACGCCRIFWTSKLLKVRLIPSLLLMNGRMVKGRQFADFRDVGHPVSTAKVYDAQGADELLFLDITASRDERGILFDVVQRTASACFMPLTVGGGVARSTTCASCCSRAPTRSPSTTEAVRRPGFVREAAARFGSQCVTVSIDARGGEAGEVYTHSGTERSGRRPGRVGARGGGTRRRRDHHPVDRLRGDARRLRSRADARRRRRGHACRSSRPAASAGSRISSRGLPEAARRRCRPRAFSTSPIRA